MFNLDPDNYKIFLSTQLEMFGIMFGVSSCISLNTIPNPFMRVHLELIIHSPGEFNNTSNHFQRLSKVSFFVVISGFSGFRHFQNLSPVCTILKKMFGIFSGYFRDMFGICSG